MRQKAGLIILIVLLFGGSYAVRTTLIGREPDGGAGQHGVGPYDRIVSLAPSITETLYALGLGDRVVGVTRYCDYPPEAQTKKKVGDYYRPNYESIVALKPDLVIILAEHQEARDALCGLRLNVLSVDHKNVAGILESITTIGAACGREQQARQLRAGIEGRIDRVRRRAAGHPARPRVMICISRTFGGSSLTKVCIAGQDGFYNEMLRLAGGVNVYEGKLVKFPEISVEGILALNPDVIIDIDPPAGDDRAKKDAILAQWQTLSTVRAVAGGRVYVLGGDYVMRPGPRFVRILEDIAGVLHPQTNAE